MRTAAYNLYIMNMLNLTSAMIAMSNKNYPKLKPEVLKGTLRLGVQTN